MVNPKIKGWRNRRICINNLEQEGWLVDVVEKTSKFAKVKDLFGFLVK